MESVILHEYRIPVNGVRKKVIYQFNDVHMALCDAHSDQAERETAAARVENWNAVRARFAAKYGEPCTEAQQIGAQEHFERLMQTAADGDALVIAGDLFDYINGAHIRLFEKRFADLSLPFLYACGNHEKPHEIPDGTRLAAIKRPVQTLDLGDLLLAAVETARREVTPQQTAELARLLTLGKPVVLVMHVPILTPNNPALAACSPYFQLNAPDAPPENAVFADLVLQNAGRIVTVLAGHLHFQNDCEIAPGLWQHVCSQGILGNINRYVIGE